MKNKTQRRCTAFEKASVLGPRTASNGACAHRPARSIARACNAHGALACHLAKACFRPALAVSDAPFGASALLPVPASANAPRRFARSRRDFTVSSRTADLLKPGFQPVDGSLESLRALSVRGQERSSTQ
jgi:hypothetical protein